MKIIIINSFEEKDLLVAIQEWLAVNDHHSLIADHVFDFNRSISDKIVNWIEHLMFV